MDKSRALKYFTITAEQGHAEAQHNSGLMYYHGDAVERDVGEATRLWKLAAAQGLEVARQNLATAAAAAKDSDIARYLH